MKAAAAAAALAPAAFLGACQARTEGRLAPPDYRGWTRAAANAPHTHGDGNPNSEFRNCVLLPCGRPGS